MLKVIGPDDDPEIVRRLVTGLISQWNNVPQSLQTSILTDAVLAVDPSSPGQAYLEQSIGQFIKAQRERLALR